MSVPSESGQGGIDEAELAALFSGENGPYVESLFEDYMLGRADVSETWRALFDRLTGRTSAALPLNGEPADRVKAMTAPGLDTIAASAASAQALGSASAPVLGVVALIDAYRTHGHLIARLDPLGSGDEDHPLLDPGHYGLTSDNLDTQVEFRTYRGLQRGTPRELVTELRHTYCETFSAEFMQIDDKERREWLIERMEPVRNRPELGPEERQRIWHQIVAAERFEQFLHKRFLGQKRFSVEGGEALIPLMDTIIEKGADLGAQEMVIAMAHRGRLNVMTHVMGMPYRGIMSTFQAALMPMNAQGSGDVKYHRGYSSDRKTRSGKNLHLSLCPNPSHLEWINPVAEGIARAKQNFRGDHERSEVIPILLHGDSAFAGQGIVPETLALSELDNYWTGGTIHIIVNNQIGFTTDPSDYLFTNHPSDSAKIIQAPIFHVNADDPEACVHAAKLAIEFRQTFKEDVIIDLVCYRRHGHNEGDDPSFTQPLLYKQIGQHPRAGRVYTDRLLAEAVVDREAVEKLEEEVKQRLEDGLEASATRLRLEGTEGYHGLWVGLDEDQHVDETTAVSHDALREIASRQLDTPEDFHVHPKLRRILEKRVLAIDTGESIDWGTGEMLAFGSLLSESTTIRVTGQDAERGTFGHRHSVLHDVESGSKFVPLDRCATGDARFIICNSLLSEAAVLGFEYGYSTVDPQRLAIWEAQFGDFSNSAQVIIDQFIASAESKWNRSSGLVMLLPHGYEGQGPEHSSARLERFLQLCAEDNLQVANLTTPAQYFHALRRQIRRNFRKPLIVMSPKSLLRHPMAKSSIDEFANGEFRTVIDDAAFAPGGLDPEATRRVLLCSGKVYYSLLEARDDSNFNDVAIVRVEELHPFPFVAIHDTLERYEAKEIVWVQEEPWNMGAWGFVSQRLADALPKGRRFRYVGRRESASPAAGSYARHEAEESEFVQEAFARRARRRRSPRR